MNQQQAIQILINAAQVANQKGAFQLAESKVIAEAVEMFTVKPAEAQVEEPKEEK